MAECAADAMEMIMIMMVAEMEMDMAILMDVEMFVRKQ